MNNFLEILIFATRILLAGMLLPFVYFQWQIRNRNGLVARLRRHTIWNTIALIGMFLQTAFFRFYLVNGGKDTLLIDITSLLVNLGVFVSFISGTKLFVDIRNGNIHEKEEAPK